MPENDRPFPSQKISFWGSDPTQWDRVPYGKEFTYYAARAEAEGRDAYHAGVFPEETDAACRYQNGANGFMRRAWFRGYQDESRKGGL